MSPTGAVAAVDLGATSGRVIVGQVGPDVLRLETVARFPNNPVRTMDGLHWNILELYRNVCAGLASAVRQEPGIRSIGVDSWAVDYALIASGRMLGNPYHYRDGRTDGVIEQAHAVRSFEQLYEANGLQFLPFNTLYQLVAEQTGGWMDHADSMLLIPDLITFWLTGVRAAERTNASTTGLLSVRDREWNRDLLDAYGFPRSLFPGLVDPGEQVGMVEESVAELLGLAHPIAVTAVGSHDTASAVVAVPAVDENFAYISSGTWSLVGVELDHAVVSESSRRANFTNEAGVDGRVRFLKNVSGLWLLSESIRAWQSRSPSDVKLEQLLLEAEGLSRSVPVFDAGDPRFVAPGDMPARIAGWCEENGLEAPRTPAEFVRSILESLAAAYAEALTQASRLSGRRVDVVHVVGGGSQNALLCQLTADATGLPVIAGPVEATAMGNILVQARSQGLLTGSLESLRSLVATQNHLHCFSPRPH